MTTSHPGFPTKPLKVGAPLDPELLDLPVVLTEDVRDELVRAQTELLYACARHRKAWKAMRARLIEREMIEAQGTIGALADIASDHIYAKRVSDVKWWAAEMTAQATTVTALKAMLPPVPSLEGWTEVTPPGARHADLHRQHAPQAR